MRRLGIAAALLAVLSLILVWEIHRDAGKLLDLPGIVEDRLPPSPVETIPASQRAAADWIVIGAREEVKKGTRYDASYQVISYPGGDVSPDRGACTDVVIRALRWAGLDLQQLIHEDMAENFALYPQNWGLTGPDPNIDHRRVPNQMTFFQRHGLSLTCQVEDHLDEWQWGDIVYWRFDNGEEHCGVISDRKNPSGRPLVIHNAGIAVEEDCLERWEIIGHFRYPVLWDSNILANSSTKFGSN